MSFEVVVRTARGDCVSSSSDVQSFTLKDAEITAHGLRHQYMHEAFKRMLGIEPPVRGGDINQVDQYRYHIASQQLMERAGHTRVTIGTAYYGRRRRTPPRVDHECGSM
jgi:integrase